MKGGTSETGSSAYSDGDQVSPRVKLRRKKVCGDLLGARLAVRSIEVDGWVLCGGSRSYGQGSANRLHYRDQMPIST